MTANTRQDMIPAEALFSTDVGLADDPEAAAIAIAQEILRAQTPEAVLSPRLTIPATDLLDTPLEIRGVRFGRSTFEEGPVIYALLDAIQVDTGEVVVVTCGGRNVLAQLYRLAQLKAFPTKAKLIRASKPTAAGFYPLWLTAA